MCLNVGSAVLGVAVLTIINNSVTTNDGGQDDHSNVRFGYYPCGFGYPANTGACAKAGVFGGNNQRVTIVEGVLRPMWNIRIVLLINRAVEIELVYYKNNSRPLRFNS